VCCFLEVGQLLLGQFALAIVSHRQLLVLYFHTTYATAHCQLLFEAAYGVCQGKLACVGVVRISGLGMVGHLAVMAARKIERRMVMFK